MIYRKIEKTGDELSLLGYGCMRYPRKNGRINEERTEKQIITAIKNGVNYFDTAYMYPGSEKVLGRILAKGYRDKVKIATKMPIFSIKNKADMVKIFEKQLKRLKTNHIDYYYIHNLIDYENWENLKKIGVLSFIKEEKEKGRIINIGFSFHGNLLNFKKIVDDYNWDSCMIQYNYLDENYQAGKDGLNYASSKGLGIIAMEPLRGGMLVNKLPKLAKKLIDEFKIKKSPAEWAFRWVADNPNIHVVLSGMNNEEDIKENISIFSQYQENSLNEDEKYLLKSLKEEFYKKVKIDCTSCGYCLPCPNKVDIPLCFSSYNDKSIFGGFMPIMSYLMGAMSNNSFASNCTQCKLCEKKCPQHISIMKELKNVASEFEKWYLKIVARIVMVVISLL
jgi:predicted aldo/keto reductase-like oxidoreductase